ncbi:hypothetical protein HK100_007037 [Physocladia obscura]|uniref:Alpha-taxilin n=1 Tax=Physocladia obscura TaxID=109957 RepID=A0AAD5SPV6_9FUNG|nr:hypothetical protein HK100_007037 [Physocladia obscura]
MKDKCEALVLSQKQEREELSSKFVSTISELASETTHSTESDLKLATTKPKFKANSNESQKLSPLSTTVTNLHDMNVKEKLMNLVDQWDMREKQFDSVVKANDIEMRLLESKLEMQKQLAGQECDRALHLRSQVASFLSTERDLRRQLQIYVDKFRQVEETLNKSNELFSTFRIEMEAMTTKTKRLETDNITLKSRLEVMNSSMVQVAQERNKMRKMIDAARFGKDKLEALCRALQTERNDLRKQLAKSESEVARIQNEVFELRKEISILHETLSAFEEAVTSTVALPATAVTASTPIQQPASDTGNKNIHQEAVTATTITASAAAPNEQISTSSSRPIFQQKIKGAINGAITVNVNGSKK